MKDLLIVIPAYNEENNIEQVITSLRQNAHGYDILVVDDGSTDSTATIAEGLMVQIVKHRVNLGIQEAIRTGMKYAVGHDYSYVLQFDADGQHDACSVDNMLKTVREEGCDIVIGSRYLNNRPGLSVRSIGSRLLSACIKLTTGVIIKDPTSGMRMYNRNSTIKFVSSMHCSPEPDTLAYLAGKGFRIREIPVEMSERSSGRSYLDITESIRCMFRMCTSILMLRWMRGEL